MYFTGARQIGKEFDLMNAVHCRIVLMVMVISAWLISALPAAAHCDTMDGPVVKDAQLDLKTADITPI